MNDTLRLRFVRKVSFQYQIKSRNYITRVCGKKLNQLSGKFEKIEIVPESVPIFNSCELPIVASYRPKSTSKAYVKHNYIYKKSSFQEIAKNLTLSEISFPQLLPNCENLENRFRN